MKINIYTDGSCQPKNPGKGGYGVLIIYEDDGFEIEFSNGFRLTTNNRMELLSVVDALEYLKAEGIDERCDINIYTDSQYVVNPINKGWLFTWLKTKIKKNSDLWLRFYDLYELYQPKMNWIKGHNGHPENEYCDKLANKAALSDSKLIDQWYEEQSKN